MFILIGAMGLNREIGNNGKLPWSLPEDLRYFKCMTEHHKILMGRRTYESLHKPLKNRHHIVISSSDTLLGDDIEQFDSIKGFHDAYKNSNEDIYVIGGSMIYKQFLPLCDILLITQIQSTFKADIFMPNFNDDTFELVKSSEILTSTTGLQYKFLTYARKNMDSVLMV
jgi:dihydrofolate reductase